MPPEEPKLTPIKLSELLDAFEFVSASDLDEHKVYICKKTGRFIFVSEGTDLEAGTKFPDEPDLADYYVAPHRRKPDLGRRVTLSFVAEELPGSLNEAMEIFNRKGAQGRFRQPLHATGAPDKWYAFEARATGEALREWCEEVGVTLIENDAPSKI